MDVEKHHSAAENLDEIGNEHDAALGQGIRKGADEGRQQYVGKDEEQLEQRRHPRRGIHCCQQGDGRDEECIISERRKKLRRHNGVKAAIHPHVEVCQYVSGKLYTMKIDSYSGFPEREARGIR